VQSGAVDEGLPTGVASFHLVREPLWRAPVALARLGTDRLRLHGTPGLRFARLLGTGRGATAMGADLARTAIFAVWEDAAALAAFEDGWFAARRAQVRAGGGEVYGVSLALRSGHGRWGGRDVLADLRRPRLSVGPETAAEAAAVEVQPGDSGGPPARGAVASRRRGSPAPLRGGPVVVLTRATVRPSRWHRFRGSRPSVSDELASARGLLAAVSIGEAPVGLQATFSIWSDAAAVAAFARSPEHRAVVRRTREEGWYGEELFARFTPLGSTGTWDGRDPLSLR
jgi:heme-degrading monooxygenase HmoA